MAMREQYCASCESVNSDHDDLPCRDCGKETEPLEHVENYKSDRQTYTEENK